MANDNFGIIDLQKQLARWNSSYNSIHDLCSLAEHWKNDRCSDIIGIKSLDDIASKQSCDGNVDSIEELVGIGTYFEPEGMSFCELISAQTFIKNDLFLITRHDVQDGETTLSADSRKVTYHQLSSKLGEDVIGKLGIKTMAYEYKSKYAISSHLHDDIYTKCELTVNPKYQTIGTVDGSPSISTLCYLKIDTEYIPGDQGQVYKDIGENPRNTEISSTCLSINMPKIILPLPPKPLIGTIRFVGLPSIQRLIDLNQLVVAESDDAVQVNPYDSNNKIRDDFDGWVFPNGTTIQNNDNQLSSASLVYNGNVNQHITTIDISELLKINPSTRTNDDNCIYTTPFSTGLGQHLHPVDPILITGDVELDLANTKFRSCSDNGKKNNIHHGPDDSTNWSNPIDIECKFNQIEFSPPLSTSEAGSTAAENYPTHQLIPIMMYIGGETRRYYEQLHDKYQQLENGYIDNVSNMPIADSTSPSKAELIPEKTLPNESSGGQTHADDNQGTEDDDDISIEDISPVINTSTAGKMSKIISYTKSKNDPYLQVPTQYVANQYLSHAQVTSWVIEFELGDYNNLKQTAIASEVGQTNQLFRSIPEWIDSLPNKSAVKLAINTSGGSYDESKGYRAYINNTMPHQIINGIRKNGHKSYDSYSMGSSHHRRYCYIDKNGRLNVKTFSMDELRGKYDIRSGKTGIFDYFESKNAWQTMNFGPVLVRHGDIATSLNDVKVSARTAIGQKENGNFVILIVNGKTNGYGTTVDRIAKKMKSLNCVTAFNLDGGGSTTLWYDGIVANTPSDSKGDVCTVPYIRPTNNHTVYTRRRPYMLYLI